MPSRIQVRRMPHLDETGWDAWWIHDEHGEVLEWRWGKSLRVSTSIAGVRVSGCAMFTDAESRQTFSLVVRLAQYGVELLRKRHERNNRGDRVAAKTVEGGEEPDESAAMLSAWTPPPRQVH